MAPCSRAQSLSATSRTVRRTPMARPCSAKDGFECGRRREGPGARLQLVAQLGQALQTGRHIAEAPVVDELRTADAAGVALEGPPVGRVAGDDHGLAVADREDREVAGLEAGDDAVRLRVGQLPVDVLVDREQGRGHRDLDVLATAGPLALVRARRGCRRGTRARCTRRRGRPGRWRRTRRELRPGARSARSPRPRRGRTPGDGPTGRSSRSRSARRRPGRGARRPAPRSRGRCGP